MRELERLHETSRDSNLAYALAVIYFHISEPKLEAARGLLESIIVDKAASELNAKAKLMLIKYYDVAKDDPATCRIIYDSITAPEDPEVRSLWEVYGAKILRDEKKYEQAEALFQRLIERLNPDHDWHAYFTANLGLAFLCLSTGDFERARFIAEGLQRHFAGHPFKSLQMQLQELERRLGEHSEHEVIHFAAGREHSVVTYINRRINLRRHSFSEKLLLLLAARKMTTKSHIMTALYQRDYQGCVDDKLIYFQVHSLRRRLKNLGLPMNSIKIADGGYRLVLRIETAKGDE